MNTELTLTERNIKISYPNFYVADEYKNLDDEKYQDLTLGEIFDAMKKSINTGGLFQPEIIYGLIEKIISQNEYINELAYEG